MDIIKAVLMGIIQGITEFLPISSSGHLSIFQNIFNVTTDTGVLFDVLLHFGTVAAIIIVFWKDVFRLIVEGFGILYEVLVNVLIFLKRAVGFRRDKGYYVLDSNPYRRFALLIIVSSVPTAIIGFVARDFAESASRSVLVPGICLMITGVLLRLADRLPDGKKKTKNASYFDAVMVGIAQGVAVLPGLSRSGITITALLALGFERKFAVKYSFIMSIPAIIGAVLLEISQLAGTTISAGALANYLAGMLTAAVVGYIAIRIMLIVVREKKYKIFSIYCIVMGLLCLIFYFIK